MSNNSPLVSVIVPVYNVAPFLQECVESLCVQEFDDYEIVLVDDGSTDGSSRLCDDMAAGNEIVSVVHKSNSGLSSARNAGIEVARGRFVTFVDSDDAVHPLYIARLCQLAQSSGADISVVGFVEGSVLAASDMGTADGGFTTIDNVAALGKILYQDGIEPSACGKLFKRELFDSVRFRENILYEDLEFIARAMPQVKTVAYCDDRLYFYRRRPTSILGVFNMRRLDVLDVTREIHERSMGTPLESAARDRRMSAAFNMLILLGRNGLSRSEESRRCWRLIKELRRGELTDRRVRLKNKLGVMLSYFGPGAVTFVGRFMS